MPARTAPRSTTLLTMALLALLSSCGEGEVGGFAGVSIEQQHDAVTAGKCPDGPTVSGVDVSVYQGGSVNWVAVKGSGQVFGIARVSDGTGSVDATFPGNWAGMKSAGLLRGAYQFFEPGGDPIAQANLVIARVGKLGEGDLPVMLDLEATGGQSAATIVARVHQWVDAITAGTGKRPFIYTGAYFWDDHVGSADFASFPLDVAWYGTNCPGTPNAWGRWTFHQYTSTGSVPGIPGHVDVNVFNGTLAQLEAFAGVHADSPARGFLDAADCTQVAGWAQDPDAPSTALTVKLSFDGAAHELSVTAGASRADLCTAIGSCAHGFSMPLPTGLRDGQPHTVSAYGIGTSGGAATLLAGSPKTVTCAPLLPAGVKRHVPDPASYTAWGFVAWQDQLSVSDATLAAFPEGEVLPGSPSALRDATSGAIYVIDGPFKRHVVNPQALAAWHLSSFPNASAQELAALRTGPDLPATPVLVKGAGPAVYLLDVPLPVLGVFDSASCAGLAGWSMDPSQTSAGLKVRITVEGSTFELGSAQERADLCTNLGSCNHGFSSALPLSLLDGKPHSLAAAAIGPSGNATPLEGSPRTVTCAVSPLPVGIRRPIASQTVEAAWGFDLAIDGLTLDDAALAAFPLGDALSPSPVVIQASDTRALYLVEGQTRRSISSAAVLAAWHVSPAEVKPAAPADVAALTEGPEVPARPIVLEGAGGALFLLDAAPPPVVVTPGPGQVTGMSATGGCSTSAGAPLPWVLVLGLLCLARRRASLITSSNARSAPPRPG